MKKIGIVFCFFLFAAISSYAQSPQKIENDALFGNGCYYFQVVPNHKELKGVLFLIPGYLENPLSVSAQSTILQEAAKNNLAVMIVNLSKNNEEFPIDQTSLTRMGVMIKHFYNHQNLTSSTKLFIGGFSIGGTCALKFYTEKHQEFKIDKVFAIDPPLDMVRLRKSLLKGREKDFASKLDVLNTQNKPAEQSLKELSVYHPDYTTLAMLPDYSNTALRIYSEPDILWWIKNRNMDLSDMNIIDGAGYINKLLQKSPNQKVELILTENKGIRNGGQRHPHSWSIAEPVDLMKWLLN